jgi:hypothetical protein
MMGLLQVLELFLLHAWITAGLATCSSGTYCTVSWLGADFETCGPENTGKGRTSAHHSRQWRQR